MARILTKREEWAKSRPETGTSCPLDLESGEQANVRHALLFLRTRLTGTAKLAASLKVKRSTLDRYLSP